MPELALNRLHSSLLVVAALALRFPLSLHAQQIDPRMYGQLRWRMIGPFRGGRTVAAVGVPGQANTFYIGVNNGGVWKTTDAGRVWTPIFDDEPTQSIGAIAIAPSDPNVIYVGSGEGLQRPDLSAGDGIYKSLDAGKTWRHLGLRDGQQIPAIAVDPRDPNRVFAAVLGHPYGPNAERGVFRSTDGGENWQKVLGPDENTGAFDVVFDPSNAQTVYAVLWAGRQAPWEVGGSFLISVNNGLFKSTDGGTTWERVGAGLPGGEQGLGRIGLGVSPSQPQRLYAVVGATRGGALYRSDDGGLNFHVANTDDRLWGRDGDFNEVRVDPKNADVLYIANVACWKSTDGGVHFTGFRGAPGGDDSHRFWINPDDTRIIMLAGDQGAIITVNGGETWSSWYNQPTAQSYHLITDNATPGPAYRVYTSQQESGSAGVWSMGPDGQITFREWHPVAAEEYGYLAVDPLHPDLIYGGKLSRYDWRTGEVRQIAPEPIRGTYRFVRSMPVLFSPVDPHILYYAGNVVFKTLNGGQSWSVISPDLTRTHYEVPANLGALTPMDPEHGAHRGVIYTIAPSFKRVNLLWAGTDDGLIWVTHDGGLHWRDVTPPMLTPWAKVSLMEASHTDTNTVYAAINTFRLDQLHPHILRTRDGGATWTEIVSGIGENEDVNVVREDPKRPGMLFAGTERGVYVSLDDGDHWQSLRENLPASSVRDLYIHDNDLVAGTHGRSIWVLDNYSSLREMGRDSVGTEHFFRPATAWRIRWNKNTDTPLPPEEPAGHNPPDGAIFDYWLPDSVTAPVVLEILGPGGRVVRRFASDDPPQPVDSSANLPLWWIRPEQRLGTGAGAHRFVWDLHEPPPPSLSHEYPISAIAGDTPREPRGPWVVPGNYRVRMTIGGTQVTHPLVVRMDPREHVTSLILAQQHATAERVLVALRRDSTSLDAAHSRSRQAHQQGGALADSLDASVRELTRLNAQLVTLLSLVDVADAPPTAQILRGLDDSQRALNDAITRLGARR
ncbi:MAG TPA: hypothetical protein VGI92_03635 [Gemmatimonadales bacterium]|jgi:photosystem II stability/assembly factor-like uncharacterized protein